jgi:hypothetical protein
MILEEVLLRHKRLRVFIMHADGFLSATPSGDSRSNGRLS